MAGSRLSRKLAAILIADVVGYARLLETDEAGTLAALAEIRHAVLDPALAAHGGRLVKTVGDGFLIEFASALEAVRCAIDVQRALATRNERVPADRAFVLRIGIDMGDVVVEGDDLFGEGVNLAARLEERAPHGGILVSQAVYDQIAGKIEAGFASVGELALKNIGKPVPAWRWTGGGTVPTIVTPDKPSIAVLPFVNMSGDPDQEVFADGITEDVITELSRYPGLFVIARNSVFIYKGRAAKVQEVGRELGVRYVLEGSVRRAGSRVRVNVQLINAGTGAHLWAERYDRDLVDIFAIQDELTRAIAATLPGRLDAAEAERVRRKPPSDMAAYDCYLAGRLHHHLGTREANAKALQYLNRAIELDPLFADAYAWRVCCLGQAAAHGYLPREETAPERAMADLRTALALDENNIEAHRILCELSMIQRRWPEAVMHNERALSLNPNDPNLVAQRGELLTWLGEPEEGADWVRTAMRLDPYDAPARAHLLGRALYAARRYAEAAAAYRQIAIPRVGHLADLAACYAQAGAAAEAAEQREAALRLEPAFTVSGYVERLAYKHAADREHHAAGLRKAGFPD